MSQTLSQAEKSLKATFFRFKPSLAQNWLKNGQKWSKMAKNGHQSKNRFNQLNRLIMPFPKMVLLFILVQKQALYSQISLLATSKWPPLKKSLQEKANNPAK